MNATLLTNDARLLGVDDIHDHTSFEHFSHPDFHVGRAGRRLAAGFVLCAFALTHGCVFAL